MAGDWIGIASIARRKLHASTLCPERRRADAHTIDEQVQLSSVAPASPTVKRRDVGRM